MTIDCPAEAAQVAPRVLLVEDHRMVGETLQAALGVHGFDVALSATATADGILEEARTNRPQLVVLDLELDGAGDGQPLIRPLIELGATVLVLTGLTDRLELARCLEAGAVGVVSKSEPFASVLEKIQRAAVGETVTPVNDRSRYLIELQEHRRADKDRLAPFEALTPRERDVLGMIVEGRRAAEIARASYVSMPTVRTQIRSILQKLEVNSQMAAAALARRSGWSTAPNQGMA